MAISKVVYGDETLIDISEDNVAANKMLSGYVAHGSNGTTVVGNIPTRSASNKTVGAGESVTIQNGYYPSNFSVTGRTPELVSTILWERSNPTSSYTSGTITLSDAIENYFFIQVMAYVEPDSGAANASSGYLKPSVITKNEWGNTGPQPCMYTLQTGNAPHKFRKFTIPKADAELYEHKRIQFDQCRDATGNTFANRLMPYQVIGYNFG